MLKSVRHAYYYALNHRIALIFLATLTFVWLLFSSIGGIGYRNFDSGIRSSLLWHLTVDPWPVWFSPAYMGERFGYATDKPYVYYFAYYMPAALVGKVFGWKAANLALFAFSYSGTLLSLLLVAFSQVQKSLLGMFCIFISICFFGGFDYVVNLLFHVTEDRAETWLTPFFYFSNMCNLYWSPQHCIPAWIIIGILLNRRYINPTLNKIMTIAVVSLILWSPLCLLGLMPFFIPHFINHWKQYFSFSLINLSAFIFFCVLILFILSNDFSFPIHFSILIFNDFWKRYLLFILVEFIFILPIIIYRISHFSTDETQFIFTAIFSLILIPFIILGTWNDWAIKVCMPSIFILSIFVGKQFILLIKSKSRLLYYAGFLFFLASLTAAEELIFSATHYEISFRFPPELRDFGPGYIVSQQLGKGDSYFFKYLAKAQ
ncbi:hypothetical protein LZG74_21370 [Dyadobacter sp. CY327]|uniref:hypothetical protein n=1 Tax=Dyadobacter sp. CY327 TaxID=2907301 RepID=UPI001F393569|nr:hypothetical protein [Dyadobacter sp. CY327]MCE7072879.1 hypothetical protein [Dyadobacter sp. CY327]